MITSDSQRQQVVQLLLGNFSERKIEAVTGLSRRQIRNIKQQELDTGGQSSITVSGSKAKRLIAIRELVKLSTRSIAVRKSEMWTTLKECFGLRYNEKTGKHELAMTDNQFRYLKEKVSDAALAQGKEALFIPEWMPRKAPVTANGLLVQMAGYLHDHATEYVTEFMHVFPGASVAHVFSELVCLAFPQASAEPVQLRCQRNAETAQSLQQRLNALSQMPAANEVYAESQDAELDRLCL